MSIAIDENTSLIEEFLERAFQDILEMSRQLFRYSCDPGREETLISIRKKTARLKEDSGRLNFRKIEEISDLLENIFYYARIRKIPVDRKFINICQRANNLCCDILKSIKTSGLEKSKNYKNIVSDMMKYLEFNVLQEYIAKDNETLDASVSNIDEQFREEYSSIKFDDEKFFIKDFSAMFDSRLVDNMVDTMGKLALSNKRLTDYIQSKDDIELLKMGQQLDTVAIKLQDDIMAIRMIPMKEILGGIVTAANRIAEEKNKKIKVHISGEEVGLDCELMSFVNNILFQLVGNAIIGGIENEQDRLILGKEKEGLVEIKVCCEKGFLVLEVMDDGQGADVERLFTGNEDHGDGTGDLRFLKKSIEKRGGDIKAISKNNQGTAFCIKIPLETEIMSVLVVESGNIKFCIEQKNIVFLTGIDEGAFEYVRDMEFYRFRGEALPVIRLNKFFELMDNDGANYKIIIVEEKENRFGIVVDDVFKNQEVIVKTLDMGFPGQDIYRGMAVTGEGTLGFVLSLKILLDKICHQKRIKTLRKPCLGNGILEQPARVGKQMLLCQSENEMVYGIPLVFVDRIEKFKKEYIEWSGEQAVIRYQGKVLPVTNFGLLSENNNEEIYCIIVDVNGIKKGFVVDNILDVGEYGGDVENWVEDITGIMGTTHIGEKSVRVVNPTIFWNKYNAEMTGKV